MTVRVAWLTNLGDTAGGQTRNDSRAFGKKEDEACGSEKRAGEGDAARAVRVQETSSEEGPGGDAGVDGSGAGR